MADLTGEQLVELAKQNRDQALEILVREYRREIYDLCVRISGNAIEAEDLAQETFIKAYENLHKFRGEASPKTWLYRIAFNQSVSFTRRLKRWRMTRVEEDSDIFETETALSTPSSEEELERKDLAALAMQELKHLPVRQRTAVVLRMTKELPYAEIARIMGTSVGGAKANVHQGIRKLRDAFGDEEPEPVKPRRTALL
ncbi:RNA polymerase sigma factor [bacterium]|nr:RNA polymerase sigma factor [bacterium]